jgi:neuromedin U receptor 1
MICHRHTFPLSLFQRLVYIYASYSGNYNSEIIISFFTYTTYISGILYYLSTCINPILYNLMSNKFRQAFKVRLLLLIISRLSRGGRKKKFKVTERR